MGTLFRKQGLWAMALVMGSKAWASDLKTLDARVRTVEHQIELACGPKTRVTESKPAEMAMQLFQPGGYGEVLERELSVELDRANHGLHRPEASVNSNFISRWEKKADQSRQALDDSTKSLQYCRIFHKSESVHEYYRNRVKAAWQNFQPYHRVDPIQGIQRDSELGPQYLAAIDETRKQALLALKDLNALSGRLEGARSVSWGCYCSRSTDPSCVSKESARGRPAPSSSSSAR